MASKKPNADGVHDFERDFRAFEQRLIRDELPHNEQVRGTAMFLAHGFEIPVLELMRDQGYDAFVAKVQAGQFDLEPGATRTPFTDDDLQRMYAYILRVLADRLARQVTPGAATH